MKYTLNLENIFNYMNEYKFNNQNEINIEKVKKITGKNFNVLLDLQDGRSWLVKQEYQYSKGQILGEFLNEWQIHKLLHNFQELRFISHFFPEILHFDSSNSVIIVNYQKNYQNLADFYIDKNRFPIFIATSLGENLAIIHKKINKKEYKEFLQQNLENSFKNLILDKIRSLERIEPEIFGMVSGESLKFFSLYQRYNSLKEAVKELLDSLQPCCLIHGDLKLNNILLHNDWKENSFLSKSDLDREALVKLIDWERGGWGDPALDLGTIIACYLQLWLESLVVSKSIDIKTSMSLATTHLTIIQPSMAAFISAYMDNFPEILKYYPDLLLRIVQCTGLSLILQIQALIQHKKSFGNKGICMLQVAKSLLCQPKQSITTIFGMTESELIHCG